MTANHKLSLPRVLVAEQFAPQLAETIQVPHLLATYHMGSDEELAVQLQQTDVFVSSMFKRAWLPADNRSLRLIQGVGAGTDGIEFSAVPNGCSVCNVYGHAYSVAEYTFMVMTALNRELMAQDRAMRRGDWSSGVFRNGLQGRMMLLLGLGHIGAEVARWANFMGMRVIALTRAPSIERSRLHGLFAIDGLDSLHRYLPEADFVVAAIPHTQSTTGYLAEAEFRLMKPSAFLVNVARGPVVDEASLYAALRERVIGGAAIDVWYRYPESLDEPVMPANYPFHELDNIIMTPHNAGTTDITMAYRFDFIGANIGRLAKGEPLHNVVWPVE